MRRMRMAIVLMVVMAEAALGCSSDATPASGSSAKLGDTCNDSVKCSEGECATAGFCTKSCGSHSDCGCASGTTDQDIANGACPLACTDGSCLKVCKTYHDCGTASCNVTRSVYMACK